MSISTSIRWYIKSLPVIGKAAPRALDAFNAAMSKAHTQLYHRFQRVKHGVSWSFLHNPRSHKLFLGHRPVLTSVQERLVADLTKKGIAVTTVEDVGLAQGDWTQLKQEIDAFSKSATELISRASTSGVNSLDLGTLRHNSDRFKRFFADPDNAQNDDYIIKMNPENSVLSADNPLIKIGLSPTILNVVNSYFGLWSKMMYADAWYSIPIAAGKRIGSQSWHRDGEDWKMVKVYLYCSDIDEDAGPMEVIPGTNHAANGPGQEIAKWEASGGTKYPAANLIEQRFPVSSRRLCIGPVGTLVFCDTTGFHRGGIPRSKARIIGTWAYVTPASLWRHRFSVRPAEAVSLREEARFAIR